MPSQSDFLTILPLLFISVWALLVLVIDLWIPETRKRYTVILAEIGLAIAVVITSILKPLSSSGFRGMVVFDGFTQSMTLIFLVSGIVGIALSYDYLKRNLADRGEYYILVLFSVSGMLLMAAANDLIIVFLALELLSIPLYILSGFFRPRQTSEEAALKYFLVGTFSSAFLLFGIAWTYGASGSMNLSEISALILAGKVNMDLFLVGASLLIVGFGFKVGVVPFHMWAPDVYNGAPSSLGAFMSVATKAAGFAGLIRVFIMIFTPLAATLVTIFWVTAAASMILGNIAAIAQNNIKRMLAYSSIANAGYILMAFVTFGTPGMAQETFISAVFFLLAYAFTSFSTWAVLISIEPAGSDGLSLQDFSGLGRKYPWLGASLLISMLSFTGVPLTMGFWGKFYLFKTAVSGGFVGLALIGLLTSLVSAYYYLRIVMFAYLKPGDPVVQPGRWVNVIAVVMAAGVLILSFFPSPIFQFAGKLIESVK
ncbi:MAG: NADH-quinone oxidoreductase subunit N [Leptolinea sp.]|nr:NADH-quinone oxidoreductase subunit N [Leptolinea sp.]